MRYRFDIHNGTSLLNAPIELEMSNLSAAWTMAFNLIRDFQRVTPTTSPNAHVYLSDSGGNIYLIPFSMALEPTFRSGHDISSAEALERDVAFVPSPAVVPPQGEMMLQ